MRRGVDSGKMGGTPNQNPWKTMGRESLWEPRAEPGTEGFPNQSSRRPMASSKVEKRKVKEMHLEISLPRMSSGEQENLRPRYVGQPPIQFSGGRYPWFQMPLVSG
jgi:hypothetical protein